jgi:hypothetical protein
VVGTVAGSLGVAGATAALGTSAGASLAASLGAAGTATVATLGGMGSAGAAIAGVLGGVTATAALPAVAGAGVAIGASVVVGKGFKRAHKTVRTRQERRQLIATPTAGEFTARASEVVVDGIAVELTLRGRAEFTAEQAQAIRQNLDAITDDPADASRTTARLRRIGFYVSDWSPGGQRLTTPPFDELVSLGLITVRTN